MGLRVERVERCETRRCAGVVLWRVSVVLCCNGGFWVVVLWSSFCGNGVVAKKEVLLREKCCRKCCRGVLQRNVGKSVVEKWRREGL